MSYCHHHHHPSLQPSQMPDRGQGYIVQWSSVSSRNTGLGHGTVLATVIIMHASHSLPFPSQYFLVIQLTRSRQLAIVIDTQHSISLTSVQASFENLRTNMQHC